MNIIFSEKQVHPGHYLALNFFGRQRFLLDYHPKSEQRHQKSVTSVTKHHRKQEREADDGEGSWVNFTVSSDTVSVYEILKSSRKLVGTVIGRWHFSRHHAIQDGGNRTSTSLLFK